LRACSEDVGGVSLGLMVRWFCGSLTPMQDYDVIIIGAGHNGLTCAAYLGMAGIKVKVVERRAIVGGAANPCAS